MSPLIYIALGKLDLLSPDGHATPLTSGPTVWSSVKPSQPLCSNPCAGYCRWRPHLRLHHGQWCQLQRQDNGITVPDPASQAELIHQTYDRYGIDPTRIQYVMAHSVGSPLGDPIEFQALQRAFRAYTDQQGFCAIGSIKPLIGHTTAASGVVGLIAMLLAMQHKPFRPPGTIRLPQMSTSHLRTAPLCCTRRTRCGTH